MEDKHFTIIFAHESIFYHTEFFFYEFPRHVVKCLGVFIKRTRNMAKIKEVEIGALIPDDKNFNKGTDEGRKLIRKSLEEFGAGRSVLVDKDMRIIAGNKTHENADAANIKKVIVVETDGSELVAVQRTDIGLDSKEGRELALADNATAHVNLEWDVDAMTEVADDYDINLDDWGVDFTDTETTGTGGATEDDFDEENDEIKPIAQSGDIFALGEHRLMCGDSTKQDDVVRLFANGELADLWLTDPPYNVGYGYEDSVRNIRTPRKDGLVVLNDKQDNESFLMFLTDAFTEAKTVLKQGATYYIFHSDSYGFYFRKALMDIGDMDLRQNLIWNKNSLVLGIQDYQWKHEPILMGWKEGAAHHWYSDRKQSTVIDWDRPTKSVEHPTMKPVGLVGYLMKNSSKDGDIIYDGFGGSGTTLIASEQLGRKCYMIELDPHYCDVIIARWEKLTGKKAKKEN